MLQYCFCFYILVFWLRGMWDLSSPTRDRTHTPCIGRRNLKHWTAREVPGGSFWSGPEDVGPRHLICSDETSSAPLGSAKSATIGRSPGSHWHVLGISTCGQRLRHLPGFFLQPSWSDKVLSPGEALPALCLFPRGGRPSVFLTGVGHGQLNVPPWSTRALSRPCYLDFVFTLFLELVWTETAAEAMTGLRDSADVCLWESYSKLSFLCRERWLLPW